MTGINPDRVPNHLVDRGHAQARDILDRLVTDRAATPGPKAGGEMRAWLAGIDAVIQEVVTARGGVEHYESILAGVASLAIGRLADMARSGGPS
ncbi:hypothetical protein AWW66_03475 [Micromonospora rosaria]|uniref:Uncharacterized protein n=1 Tax=Micromonospora rosaria TaxID=47874 RepID=A0A136PYF5_9ACTN|nr:hypothetical protein [Micromonospora rosaria]KXK63387.1 hypothetical protein AWW66_03475 [Micromonospora rosaria]